jgi:hypothetical protein
MIGVWRPASFGSLNLDGSSDVLSFRVTWSIFAVKLQMRVLQSYETVVIKIISSSTVIRDSVKHQRKIESPFNFHLPIKLWNKCVSMFHKSIENQGVHCARVEVSLVDKGIRKIINGWLVTMSLSPFKIKGCVVRASPHASWDRFEFLRRIKQKVVMIPNSSVYIEFELELLDIRFQILKVLNLTPVRCVLEHTILKLPEDMKS